MNQSFDTKNPTHKNLIAKLNNSVADLNFYAWRFLKERGLECDPKTAILQAIKYASDKWQRQALPDEVFKILKQYSMVIDCEPKDANELFYSTWIFLHNFDSHFK